ncbi:MAG: hypothetical protein HY867_03855 [Chloroflexi bacterium]|nr:hypothetical protein [Chloroflexota bacterium]
MNTESVKSAWIKSVLAFFFLAFGLISLADALFEIQSQAEEIVVRNWSIFLSGLLALLFGAGWGLPLYLKKYDRRVYSGKANLVMLLVISALEISLLWVLSSLRFQYHVFVACQMIFVSGLLLRISLQNQQKT